LDSVDIILLAGGSTRMPMVHKMLERVFGRPPATDINPDEAIALGAALSAAIESAELRGEQPIVSMRTRDVTSHSLGMVVYRDDKLHNSTVIHKNTPIPTEMTREDYSTSRDDQTTMDVWLVQGEDPDPVGCVELGHFEFYGIPPRKAGVSPLKVTFRYNQNGMVEVEAMDTESRRVLPHRLSPGNITLQDVVNDRTPVQIAVLMDCSGSVYGPHYAQAKQVATRFITQSLALPHRQLALISFPGGVRVPPTTDVARLSSAMDDLVPIGVSPLGQALTTTRRLLRPKAGAKQLLVVFSDGTVDDPSLVSHEIKHLRTAGTRIITVGIGSHIDADFLSKLSTSGTNYHPCHDKLELDSSFLNLATQEASI
jgi:molecular chaperone DnaK